jgi:hypothetical protein
MNNDTISILTVESDQPASGGEMGIFHRQSPENLVVREIGAGVIATNLSRLCGTLSGVLENVKTSPGAYSLQEVTISAEITAEGNLNIVGVAQVGGSGKGAISMTFRR